MGLANDVYAQIGVIMLVGIAVNDSIILVDRINQLIREGIERKDAILLAGPERRRISGDVEIHIRPLDW